MSTPTRIKYLCLPAAALSLIAAPMASAAIINPFSNDLSDYTGTVILDNGGGGKNTSTWEITNNELSLNTTVYDASGVEQWAFIQNGLSLSVGDEIKVSLTAQPGNRDFGLYVGGTTPVADVRQNYVSIYVTGTASPSFAGRISSRGFDGTSEYGNITVDPSTYGTYEALFIARTDTNTYELGYYTGDTRNVLAIRTPSTPNDGSVVGFYADVRDAGILGYATVVPEPGTIALIALGGLMALFVLPRRLHRRES